MRVARESGEYQSYLGVVCTSKTTIVFGVVSTHMKRSRPRVSGADRGPVHGGDPPNRRAATLVDRSRSERASVNGNVRYVLLGAMSLIGTAILANLIF